MLDDKIDLKTATIAYINPLTAIAMLEVIKKKNQKVMIATAAASQIQKQFYKLTQDEGYTIINIVRKDAAVKQLEEELKSKINLNSSHDNFF